MTSQQSDAVWNDRVVVGIDGSAHSRAALSWAARQAKLTGATLTVVAAWDFPTSFGAPIPWPGDVDFAAEARTILDEAVSDVLGAYPEVEVTKKVVQGRAASVLLDESRTAGLLVVGSRGHGEFTGMLIGSVSEFLTTHAFCPVLVIRGRADS